MSRLRRRRVIRPLGGRASSHMVDVRCRRVFSAIYLSPPSLSSLPPLLDAPLTRLLQPLVAEAGRHQDACDLLGSIRSLLCCLQAVYACGTGGFLRNVLRLLVSVQCHESMRDPHDLMPANARCYSLRHHSDACLYSFASQHIHPLPSAEQFTRSPRGYGLPRHRGFI
ncbi:hypothetical protein BJ322DRAFT_278631 [Thelephora terrestris]|uniref:Uncharacterized protein n=1 Tax=Thelephora terrestris TaxID=56493 RepID=A0A9P6H6S4_9AGAM|nr:hypothetical protein BJ322DRAFT_278631 [Thelephora terrestris]